MSLCDLCKEIPFDDLPAVPAGLWNGRPSEKYIHPFYSSSKERYAHALGHPHHKNLENLRASAESCELCKLIATQAELFIAEYDGLSEDNRVRGNAHGGYPDFDLWLTKRRDGGDGFWVFTSGKDRFHKKRETVFLLATVGLCVTEDSPLANLLPGRPVDDITKLETMLTRISKWVKTCDKKHLKCGAVSVEIRPMPDFILEVVAKEDATELDSIRLIETKGDINEKYIALSHCWGTGGSPPLITTKSTLEERKKKINFHDLPASFRDAVSVTRSLGIRYLWIDSLCIIQDDAKDWERQSGNMESVYSYAYLTVAASRAKDSHGGCLHPRVSRQHVALDIKKEGVLGKALAFIPPLRNETMPDLYVEMENEPLSDRAWCFQERVLSSRILHLASDQMYFECIDGFRSEDGLHFSGRYHSIHPNALPYDPKPVNEKGGQPLPLLEQWLELLWGYGPRTLTKPTDKFPALSGIARVFGERMNDDYIAGIWKGAFIESLLWQGLSITEVADTRAPSWSWGHYKGICAGGISEGTKWREIGTISSYFVELESAKNPYGAVKEGGWVELQAPLVPLTLIERGPDDFPYIYFRAENSNIKGVTGGFDQISRKYSESAEVVRNMEIYALVLIIDEPVEECCLYRCLLVTPVSGRVGTFRRLGFTFGNEKSLGIKEMEFASQRVVLV